MSKEKHCDDCCSGPLKEIETTGAVETIAGIQAYVARPSDVGSTKEPIGVVVIFPDVFGWKLPNTRALADAYAQLTPAVVVVPDLYNGHYVPAKVLTSMDCYNIRSSNCFLSAFSAIRWHLAISFYSIPVLFATIPQSCDARLIRLLQTLRTFPLSPSGSATKLNRIAVAGFCHGGQTAVRLTHGAGLRPARRAGILEPLVDCAFTAHPSFLDLPRDWKAVVLPLSLANGDEDMMMTKGQMVEAQKILGQKEQCEVVTYPGAMHGFGTRGNPKVEGQREIMEKSRDQAVKFFRKHLDDGEQV